jgi:hypothetical protein
MRLLFLSAPQRRIKSKQNALAAEMRVFIRSNEMHTYEVRPRKDKRGVDLVSDVLPFGRGCGMMDRKPWQTRSDTRSILAAHMVP